MRHYELYKCRFIVLFVIFVLSFSSINLFYFFTMRTLVYGFCLICSFAYMVNTILLFKANDKLKNDFYKLCFYLLSGASAFCLFNIIKITANFLFNIDMQIFILFAKELVFLTFLIYFAIYSYKKIIWNFILLNVAMF